MNKVVSLSIKDFTLRTRIDCNGGWYECKYGEHVKETIGVYMDGQVYLCHQDDVDGYDEHWFTVHDSGVVYSKYGLHIRRSTLEALYNNLNSPTFDIFTRRKKVE